MPKPMSMPMPMSIMRCQLVDDDRLTNWRPTRFLHSQPIPQRFTQTDRLENKHFLNAQMHKYPTTTKSTKTTPKRLDTHTHPHFHIDRHNMHKLNALTTATQDHTTLPRVTMRHTVPTYLEKHLECLGIVRRHTVALKVHVPHRVESCWTPHICSLFKIGIAIRAL